MLFLLACLTAFALPVFALIQFLRRPAASDATPWTLDRGLALLRGLEAELSAVGYHCALAGSVMYRGQSAKDLDVVIYPHKTQLADDVELQRVLEEFGFNHVEAAGYRHENDNKQVDIYDFRGRRVDVMRLQ